MNKQMIAVAGLILAAIWVLRPHTGLAQDAAKNFAGVVPFGTAAGTLGMFDQNTGMIYVYDTNLAKVIFTGHLPALGQPIEPISVVGQQDAVGPLTPGQTY